ncbi:MAG TPA: HlyD family efflux transporter periplasmic adaptor subunit [Polyangiaceae bacterium]|nr:HlyD family efflux transporter periplasmic adaptor subunit [Polyangiaceae bacterium]
MRFAVLLALAALGALSCAHSPGQTEDWVAARRDDLKLQIDVSGTMRAVKSDVLGPPDLPDVWDYKISFMAPEGAAVKQGDVVVGFDDSQLTRTLEEKKTEAKSVAKQIEKKQSEAQMARQAEVLKIAEAEANQRKAQLKVDVPSDLAGSLELKKAQIDADAAAKELAHEKSHAELARRADAAELAALGELLHLAEQRVSQLQSNIDRMKVRAPRDGIVIYYVDPWRGTKKKVGDSCQKEDKVLETDDLSVMIARGEVDEVDSARILVGQRVMLRLDAHPDTEFGGHIESIGKIVQRASPKNPLKVMRLDVALDQTDPQRMLPGMHFRGNIEIGSVKNVVVVPNDAVSVTSSGPVVWRKTAKNVERTLVELGKRNRDEVEVRSGVAAGDLVSRIDLSPDTASGGTAVR